MTYIPPSYHELRAELRRTNKPLMEKRRRARINVCLSQLKSLVLDASSKDAPRYSKLEKADILEMTVKYLKQIHRQRPQTTNTTEPTIAARYLAGYSECANHVIHFFNQSMDVDPQLRKRVVNHLANRVQSSPTSHGPAPAITHNVLSGGKSTKSEHFVALTPQITPHNESLTTVNDPSNLSTSSHNVITMSTYCDSQPLDLTTDLKVGRATTKKVGNEKAEAIWRPW